MPKIKIPIGDPPTPGPKPSHPPSPRATEKPLFDSLFPCSWRGIPFPVASIRVSLTQDLAEHKYWGKDSASVESTGRDPLQIEAIIPFVNGIVPGKNERWGVLYPTTFIQFLEAFNDRTTGILDTPEIAGLTCKPVSLEFSHDAQRRDGVEVTARWVETIDEDIASDVKIAPAGAARLAALNLDAQKSNLDSIHDPPEFDETFESLMNKVTGLVDTTVSRFQLLVNKPNQILYRIKRLQNSVERARSALTWPVTEACEKLREAVGPQTIEGTGVQGNGRTPSRKTRRFSTPTRMTLSALQALFPQNSMDDLIYLNPRLIARPTVPPKTVLRYYV